MNKEKATITCEACRRLEERVVSITQIPLLALAGFSLTYDRLLTNEVENLAKHRDICGIYKGEYK